jgi:predicted nucleic-acid-binding protein
MDGAFLQSLSSEVEMFGRSLRVLACYQASDTFVSRSERRERDSRAEQMILGFLKHTSPWRWSLKAIIEMYQVNTSQKAIDVESIKEILKYLLDSKEIQVLESSDGKELWFH